MTKKIFAVLLLSLALTACESSSTENANTATKPDAATPTPATSMATTSPESSPSTATPIKAGDKVKVTINGVATEATVVSVDEKAGKATVKIQGQKEDKTVAISAIVKQ
jgi:hypothetical protein